jgi:type II secretory ATPase GspE/PulE/Tfp pilus assembly ATPase PilB-like protein
MNHHNNGYPPTDVSAAVGRLRQHLRDTLNTELPQRVEEQQHRIGTIATREGRRELARQILDHAVGVHSENELMANRPLVERDAEQKVVGKVVNELFGMAGLQPLLDDPTVETINVNRYDRVFVQYDDGRRAAAGPITGSNEELTDLVRLLAARASSQERRFDQGSPTVNLQLPGGERLFAVMGLTAGGVTALSIRRHGYLTVTLSELRRRGTLDPGLEQFVRALVKARKNVLITGGTGAGKTTLLRALAGEMDPLERIVTIEDAFELGLDADPGIHAGEVKCIYGASCRVSPLMRCRSCLICGFSVVSPRRTQDQSQTRDISSSQGLDRMSRGHAGFLIVC